MGDSARLKLASEGNPARCRWSGRDPLDGRRSGSKPPASRAGCTPPLVRRPRPSERAGAGLASSPDRQDRHDHQGARRAAASPDRAARQSPWTQATRGLSDRTNPNRTTSLTIALTRENEARAAPRGRARVKSRDRTWRTRLLPARVIRRRSSGVCRVDDDRPPVISDQLVSQTRLRGSSASMTPRWARSLTIASRSAGRGGRFAGPTNWRTTPCGLSSKA